MGRGSTDPGGGRGFNGGRGSTGGKGSIGPGGGRGSTDPGGGRGFNGGRGSIGPGGGRGSTGPRGRTQPVALLAPPLRLNLHGHCFHLKWMFLCSLSCLISLGLIYLSVFLHGGGSNLVDLHFNLRRGESAGRRKWGKGGGVSVFPPPLPCDATWL